MADPTQRFSTRVEDYVKYRPGYPQGVIATLREECGLMPATVIADVGSGTGILTQLFLSHGNRVLAVEPNAEMRAAAERLLARRDGFTSIDGRAEATTLPDRSVDAIVAGQAFHWFDRDLARREFERVLAPGGWIMLIWNERDSASTPLLLEYEEMLRRWSPEYARVDHRQVHDEILQEFFGPRGCRMKTYPHRQVLDHAGLRGRLLSSSYAPEAGHPNHEPMMAELDRIWQAHEVGGRVAFDYEAKMFYGALS